MANCLGSRDKKVAHEHWTHRMDLARHARVLAVCAGPAGGNEEWMGGTSQGNHQARFRSYHEQTGGGSPSRKLRGGRERYPPAKTDKLGRKLGRNILQPAAWGVTLCMSRKNLRERRDHELPHSACAGRRANRTPAASLKQDGTGAYRPRRTATVPGTNVSLGRGSYKLNNSIGSILFPSACLEIPH